jgi:hypothetical protein
VQRRPPEIPFRFILQIVAVLLGAFCCQGAFAAADLMITGKVSNSERKPIADATVMVYHAGPTTGYSLFCPSCYVDCGKRCRQLAALNLLGWPRATTQFGHPSRATRLHQWLPFRLRTRTVAHLHTHRHRHRFRSNTTSIIS